VCLEIPIKQEVLPNFQWIFYLFIPNPRDSLNPIPSLFRISTIIPPVIKKNNIHKGNKSPGSTLTKEMVFPRQAKIRIGCEENHPDKPE
jgi:hypothetical protein